MPDQEPAERRLRKRYSVSALARYRWQDSNGTWSTNSGMTLNMSVAGVYILTAASPPAGASIEMRVAMSAVSLSSARGYFYGKGVVTRTDPEAGFAAQVDLRMLRVQRSDPSPAK